MMKIFYYLIFFYSLIISKYTNAQELCNGIKVDGTDGSMSSASEVLAKCGPTQGTIVSTGQTGLEGAKKIAIDIADNIIILGSVVAIASIVYAGFLFASANGADDKIKNAKQSMIWGLIGFFTMIIAYPLVNLIIDFIYEL